MRIRIKTSISGNADTKYGISEFSFAPGDVVDVVDELAVAWIKSGIAEPIDTEEYETTTMDKGKRKKAKRTDK